MFVKENRMKEIQHIIRSIDRDRNGYVTRNELDDILKEVYPELRKKDLMRLIKPFCSVSNKILVDYGRFKSFVNDMVLSVSKPEHSKKNEGLIAAGKTSSKDRIPPGTVVHVKDLLK